MKVSYQLQTVFHESPQLPEPGQEPEFDRIGNLQGISIVKRGVEGVHDLAEILKLAVDKRINLRDRQKPGQARQKSDLSLDLLANGLPANHDFNGFGGL